MRRIDYDACPVCVAITKLSKRPHGYRFGDDLGLDGVSNTGKLARSRLQVMQNAGRMYPAKLSHRLVHYFNTLKRADAFLQEKRPSGCAPVRVSNANRAAWSVDTPGIITERTKITIAPPMPTPRLLRTNTHTML